ncbi:MAG TPA: hypothetical protein VFJ82_25485 [Longimicrobium sp.]|nr:hypothetical protein [Longimicrobium sp.]
MAFISQQRHRGPGRFLQVKIWLFSAGAILLLVGMARNLDLLVGAAIAVLAIAFLLRFFERDQDDEPEDEEDFDDPDEPAAEEAHRVPGAADGPVAGTGHRPQVD